MTDHRLTKILQSIRRVLPPPDAACRSDGQLLARFVSARDEAAFAVLVRRHGPMVYGVCRRVLGHAHDAEDAFQATFLVLVRKAGSVLKCGSVGGWLCGVAYRTALEARGANARRRAWQKQMADPPHPTVGPEEPRDWRPLLDRELSRLPEKYRAAVVLCDLENRPRKEAASRLGIPEGTLSSRLATARRRLARRLARVGLALSGGALAAALCDGAATAATPAGLCSTTVQAASLAAAGRLASVRAGVVLLTKGVLRAMWISKLKMAAVVLAATVVIGTGGLLYRGARGSAVQAADGAPPPNELEALRKENELLKLNLEVVLEKVRAQECELAALKAEGKGQGGKLGVRFTTQDGVPFVVDFGKMKLNVVARPDPEAEAEAALKALRSAKDDKARAASLDALDKALQRLRGPAKPQVKKSEGN